jgi:hypothetical protein
MIEQEKKEETERIIQSISSGSELNRIKKYNKKQLKKHYNHED